MTVQQIRARTGLGAALLAAATLFAAAPADAQSACGASYTVRPGDTLSKIAARCGTSVGALTRANAFIRDPARIEIGWTLAMPGGEGYGGSGFATAPAPAPVTPRQPYSAAPAPVYQTPAPDPYLPNYGTYSVQPGDTFATIAQALGISLAALLAENSGADPARLLVGQLLQVPGYDSRYDRRYDPRYDRRYDDRRYDGRYDDDRWDDDDRDDRNRPARLRLKPSEGQRGSKVELRVDRLNRGEWLALGVRDRGGRMVKLAEARADKKGRVKTTVRVPDWADPRDDLVFVARRQDGGWLRSHPFDVKGRRADRRDDRDDRDGGLLGGRRRGTAEGWIVRGVECPVLRTPSGTSYSLVSDDVRLPLGAYVELTGRRVDFSTCMEGAGTIDVSSLRRVDPPR